MKLIASGRASEIFDLGDNRVLRRFKVAGDPEREALVMRHAGECGYLVPRVLDVTADALILERIDGPTMAAQVRSDPSTACANAVVLARLHEQLHAITAPPGLAAVTGGDRLLHLDLHPANVILSPNGPVVIDWTNARRGDPAFDVAVTWVICATSEGGARAAEPFLEEFLSWFDEAELSAALPAAAEWRLTDTNVTDEERSRIRGLPQEASSAASSPKTST